MGFTDTLVDRLSVKIEIHVAYAIFEEYGTEYNVHGTTRR